MIDYVLGDISSELAKKFGYSKAVKVHVIESKNLKEIKKLADKPSDLVFVKGLDEELNRIILASKKIDVLIDCQDSIKKDSFHYRNSGLTQVSCSIAKKNNIAIGFSLRSILKSINRPLVLGRIKQNIKLCRKYKLKMLFCSLSEDTYDIRNSQDMLSLAKILGMNPGEAKKALNLNIR